ncbi:MAG: 4Fe-4S binding protein [Synergistaceae bacterium]|nr:4Fe-4S binding protein [Synergistaceae bacterium]
MDIVNDLAVINQENCIKCGVCAKVCPAKCINTGEKVPVMEKSA